MDLSIQVSHAFPLGYMGLDWVLDSGDEPRLLELNARPGLEIQNANQQGLRALLENIEESL